MFKKKSPLVWGRCAALLALALAIPQAHAIGLGELVLHSHLGENLRAEIRILGDGAERATTACFSTLSGHELADGDLPAIPFVQFQLGTSERGGNITLFVRSRLPITEPMSRLVVQAGCGFSFRRDYVVLLSPAEYEEKLQIAQLLPAAEAAATAPAASPPGTSGGDGAMAGASAAAPPVPAPAAVGPKVAATTPKAKKRTARPQTSHAARVTRPRGDRVVVATPQALSGPTLAVAKINLSGEPASSAAGLKSRLAEEEAQREKAQAMLQSLEVHVVSLQKQLEDLKQQIRHKEDVEKRLLAQAQQPRTQLFASEEAGGGPTEFLWMLLVVAGVGSASAALTYRSLKRSAA